MPIRYREERATQAAARLLTLRGGEMSYMKLIKLLYLADRKALADLGRPITFDAYVSMAHGPVLSCTLDRITGEPDPDTPSYWRTHISGPTQEFTVRLERDPSAPDLSRAEEEILKVIFSDFGHMTRWEVVRYTHSLAEWRDPGRSCFPINIRDVLLVQGVSEEDADGIVSDLAADSLADAILV